MEYWGYIGGYIGLMQNNMETTVLSWGIYWGDIKGYLGMMENKIETTIQGFRV